MASEYSPWVWSPEHQRHYCWRHNEDGVVEYQWSGSAPQTQAPSTPRYQPGNQAEGEEEDEEEDEDTEENPQSQQAAVAQQSSQHRTPSYSLSTAQSAQMQHSTSYRTSQQPVSPSTSPQYTHQQPVSQSTSPQYTHQQPVSQSTSPQYTHQQPVSQSTSPQYTHQQPVSQSTSPQYTHQQPVSQSTSHYTHQQPVSQNTSPHYTHQQPVPQNTYPHYTHQQPVSQSTSPHYPHQQLPHPGSAQPAVSPPAQPPKQQKPRDIKTGIDGKEYEELDPRYQRVSQRSQANFFCHGRVFMMLWTEPAGRVNPGRTRGSTHFSVVKYSETVYSEIRRFVVVRNKGAFSQCVPIQTYRRQGATKVGVLVEDHAVIYTGGERDPPPPLLEGEGITKQALRVVADGNETLDVYSRINFGKTYTVEHNVKVLSIGTIAREHAYLLEHYWKLAHE